MSLLSIRSKFDIPSDWEMVPIGKVVVSSQYGTSSGNSEIGVPIIGMKNLQEGKVNFDNLSVVSVDEAEKEKLLLHKGDILLNRTNSYDLVGKVGYVDQDYEAVFASYLVRLEVDKTKTNPKFVAIWLSSFWADQMIKKIATRAVSQANVNPTEFKKFCLIPVLPLPEQTAIVDLLSTWDEAIEKTERLVKAKEKRFKWLLRELISEPRNTRKDTEWKKVKLGEVCIVTKGKQLNVEHMKEDGLYYALNGGIEASGRTDDWNTEAETITISEGGNSCGYVNYNTERFWAGGHCYSLLSLKMNTDKNYLYFYLCMNKPELMKLRVGSGLPNIQKKDIDKFIVELPSLDEQQRIAETLSSGYKEIDLLKQLADKYKTQKRGLMQKMLTGEWRVNNFAE